LNARQLREVKEAQLTAVSSYDVDHEVWDLALKDHVSKALDELPREERRAIELAYFKGYTYVEVAHSLGQPEGTVKSRIRNGMHRMRTALIEAGIQGADA
jgi:RNA polymerase sigma-70 factor (ECF subfamily)